MKKLMLVATLCVAALVVVPISSASAATYTGACVVEGNAEFTSGALSATPSLVTYKFDSTKVTCGPGVGVAPTSVTVKNGEVDASCVSPVLSAGDAEAELLIGENKKDGEGEVNGEASRKFDLDIEGSALGVVNIKAEKELLAGNPLGDEEMTAGGFAEFFTSTVNKPASECFTGSVKHLEFKAVISGTI